MIAALITGSGLLLLLLALPLIYRRVPPNALYGVRTRASFYSEADWYRINALGGRYLAMAAVFMTLVGLAGFFLPDAMLTRYSIAAAVLTFVAVATPCVRLCRMRSDGARHHRAQ